MPKFNKSVDELETRFDKWLYVLKNMTRLDNIPEKLREKIFLKLFETAEIARFTPEQAKSYEESLKHYRDLKNSLDTAHDEGYEEGIEEGIKLGIEEGRKEGIEEGRNEANINTINKLHNSGFSKTQIAEILGFDISYVENILSKAK
jgi:predicted transposase/invertase (TIGR01784 family)